MFYLPEVGVVFNTSYHGQPSPVTADCLVAIGNSSCSRSQETRNILQCSGRRTEDHGQSRGRIHCEIQSGMFSKVCTVLLETFFELHVNLCFMKPR